MKRKKSIKKLNDKERKIYVLNTVIDANSDYEEEIGEELFVVKNEEANDLYNQN